jgi:hypothetical protein
MWFLDGPEYFSPPGRPPRYLTYQNDVRQYVERLAEERHGGAMPVLYKQIVALSYQLAQFRCAQLAAGSWQLAASRRGRLQAAIKYLTWSLHSLQGLPQPSPAPLRADSGCLPPTERLWLRPPC